MIFHPKIENLQNLEKKQVGFSHCYNMNYQEMKKQGVSTRLNNIQPSVILGLVSFRNLSPDGKYIARALLNVSML